MRRGWLSQCGTDSVLEEWPTTRHTDRYQSAVAIESDGARVLGDAHSTVTRNESGTWAVGCGRVSVAGAQWCCCHLSTRLFHNWRRLRHGPSVDQHVHHTHAALAVLLFLI